MERYMQYPQEDDRRSGCKVSWNYYRDKAKAEECAKAAVHNARLQEQAGYDFGYCAPGSIEQIKKGDRAGMYEVCLP